MSQSSANLDVLRASAVLAVLFDHTLQAFGLLQTPLATRWGIDSLGHFGVLMFFIHTSLVLMMSMERLARTAPGITGRFYIRRAFRIYPLSILTVLAAVTAHLPPYFEPHYRWLGAKVLWTNLFLVQNIFNLPSQVAPLWSLPFEVQMYLLLPLLYYWISGIRSNRLAAGAVITAGFAAWYLEGHLAQWAHYPALFEYAPWFCMGIACFALSRRRRGLLPGGWYVLTVALFVTLPCLAYRVIGDYRSGWVLWLAGIFFVCTLPSFRDVANSGLRRVAHTIAKYSYGIYLAHVPILWFAFEKLGPQRRAEGILVAVALLIAVPVVLYHFVEEPFIRMGARLATRLTPPRAHEEAVLRGAAAG